MDNAGSLSARAKLSRRDGITLVVFSPCILPSKLRPGWCERQTLTIDLIRRGDADVVARRGDGPLRLTGFLGKSVNTAHDQCMDIRTFRLVRTFVGRFH